MFVVDLSRELLRNTCRKTQKGIKHMVRRYYHNNFSQFYLPDRVSLDCLEWRWGTSNWGLGFYAEGVAAVGYLMCQASETPPQTHTVTCGSSHKGGIAFPPRVSRKSWLKSARRQEQSAESRKQRLQKIKVYSHGQTWLNRV